MDNSNRQSFPPEGGGGGYSLNGLVLTAKNKKKIKRKKTKKPIRYINWKNMQIARYVGLENKPSLGATSIE